MVKDITGGVGSVSCGSAHTLALSSDGKIVWSFGAGDHGKLGHGDTSKHYKPKVIEGLQGMDLVKVVAGSQISMALTTNGEVWVWGGGPCLGSGSAEAFSHCPQQVEDLCDVYVVDISVGDSHCLALAQDSSVYAWGLNSMGQCGLGHVNSPIVRPAKVKASLDGVPIHQISAGTSHSMAWTTLPSDKRSIAWQKPFCVDLNLATFEVLRKMLLHSNENTKMNLEERNQLSKYVLRILGAHLALVSNAMQRSYLIPEIAE